MLLRDRCPRVQKSLTPVCQMRPFSFHHGGLTLAQRRDARFEELVERQHTRVIAASASAPLPTTRIDLATQPLVVAVRQRPLNTAELASHQFDVISCLADARTVVLHEPRLRYTLEQDVVSHEFEFDAVFAPGRSNGSVYRALLGPHIARLDRGAQVTLFAYGQTGSGKTYTVSSLIQRSLDDVFALVTVGDSDRRRLFIGISYFEIYCNAVYDLLGGGAPLALREDALHAVQVVGLTEHATRDIRVARAVVAAGAAARHTGSTRVNATSSRSHAVLQLLVREVPAAAAGASCRSGSAMPVAPLVGKCVLVDLAGSEHASEAEHGAGDRAAAVEAAEINKSLLALKECIRAMGRRLGRERGLPATMRAPWDGRGDDYRAAGSDEDSAVEGDSLDETPLAEQVGRPRPTQLQRTRRRPASASCASGKDRGRRPASSASGPRDRVTRSRGYHLGAAAPSVPPASIHVPFRGSKLTHILRDCFTSPGASTIMLAALGPGHSAAEHTLNTLRYAARLKGVGDAVTAARPPRRAGGSGGSAPSGAHITAICDSSASCSRRVGILWNGGTEVWPDGTVAPGTRASEGFAEPAPERALLTSRSAGAVNVVTSTTDAPTKHGRRPLHPLERTSQHEPSGAQHAIAPAATSLSAAQPTASTRVPVAGAAGSETSGQADIAGAMADSYLLVPRGASSIAATDAPSRVLNQKRRQEEPPPTSRGATGGTGVSSSPSALVAALDAQIEKLTALRERALVDGGWASVLASTPAAPENTAAPVAQHKASQSRRSLPATTRPPLGLAAKPPPLPPPRTRVLAAQESAVSSPAARARHAADDAAAAVAAAAAAEGPAARVSPPPTPPTTGMPRQSRSRSKATSRHSRAVHAPIPSPASTPPAANTCVATPVVPECRAPSRHPLISLRPLQLDKKSVNTSATALLAQHWQPRPVTAPWPPLPPSAGSQPTATARVPEGSHGATVPDARRRRSTARDPASTHRRSLATDACIDPPPQELASKESVRTASVATGCLEKPWLSRQAQLEAFSVTRGSVVLANALSMQVPTLGTSSR